MRHIIFAFLFLLFSFPSFSQQSNSIVATTVEHIKREQWDSVYQSFSDDTKLKISLDQLKTVWLSLQMQLGGVVAFYQEEMSTDETGVLCVVPVEFTTIWIDIRFHVSIYNEIDGIFFVPGTKRYPYIFPSYVNKESFMEEKIRIPALGAFLNGTICLPKHITNPPLVILVHGSGPNDMDETMGPNKIFKDLSYGLASHGIAVIRYNKRTKEIPHLLDANLLTFEDEVVDDVNTIIQMAKSGEWNIDTNNIYVFGHSLGGFLAPYIAAKTSIAGIIVAAGNARPLEDLIEEQYEYLYKIDGELTDYEKRDLKSIQQKAKDIRKGNFSKETPISQLLLGLNANYWLSLKNYQPIQTALYLPEQTRILVLQGERDYQVLYNKDFKLWNNKLKKRKGTQFYAYPTLNHYFLPGEGKSIPQEYEQYHPFFEKTLFDIIHWIKN